MRTRILLIACAVALAGLSAAPDGLAQSTATPARQATAAVAPSPVVAAFEERAREYSQLRERLEGEMPKLSKDAKPEEIEAHKASFQERVRAARAGAQPGQIFTPEIAAHIRATILREYRGKELADLRESVLEAQTQGVPVRINYSYPESKELAEMPPTLLLKLPQLPKQLRYRFVGQHLLLVDRENGLIVDYMLDAFPATSGDVARAASEAKEDAVAEAVAAANAPPAPAAPPLRLTLPNKEGSVRFVAIGDTGTGTEKQKELANVMLQYRAAFPYEFVLMMGDNMYGGEKPHDFKAKFEDIYRPLLDAQVKFYASLGNHDESNQRFYEHFNMNGEEYYRLKKGNVAFYALNSNYMDKRQVKWLEEQLAKDDAEWKVAFFHHPPYSSGGKHGSSSELREVVEPIFLKYGVNVVFAGHEHFYERVKPQKGIHYFITGAGGKLRPGDVKDNSPLTAKAFDQDMSFMLVEVAGDEMHFQVISRTGETVDSGVVVHQRKQAGASSK